MADLADVANATVAMEINALLSFRNLKPDEGAAPILFCVDCGEPIPEMRRKMVPGTKRCVECQEEYEREFLYGN